MIGAVIAMQSEADILLDEMKISRSLTVSGKKIHVGKAYGGMPLFEPFDCITEIESRDDLPLIASSYRDSEGGKYFSICNNSSRKVASVTLRIKDEAVIERCYYSNRFGAPSSLTDPVGELYNKGVNTKTYTFFLSPGQIVLYREK